MASFWEVWVSFFRPQCSHCRCFLGAMLVPIFPFGLSYPKFMKLVATASRASVLIAFGSKQFPFAVFGIEAIGAELAPLRFCLPHTLQQIVDCRRCRGRKLDFRRSAASTRSLISSQLGSYMI
jgi:hypothetical protein